MSDEIVAAPRRNWTLDDALLTACEREGLHWFKCFRLRLALRRCSDCDHLEIERELTRLLVASGVELPAGASVVDGALVGDWKEFIEMIIANLPAILDFLMKLLPFIIGLF